MTAYVCAFRGRRDSYQVPLALAEANLLDQFITDAYSNAKIRSLSRMAPMALRSKMNFRHIDGIPESRVKCLWPTTAVEHFRHKFGFNHESTYQLLDPHFSLAAAKRAEATGANLFLYSSYAWEAFQQNYTHSPRKILFQYHPHPDLEEYILQDDDKKSKDLDLPITRGSIGASRGDRDAWRFADLIVCASSFTKQSLLEAGCDESLCHVVPYGVDLPLDQTATAIPRLGFHALFVGSGVQRKGLHHLLLAWRKSSLPPQSRLTLVCRVLDPGMRNLINGTPGVTLLQGVSASALEHLYANSHLFVMPSLVEGFGQVYLESLAKGCPVLGTANTCLPDVGSESDGIFLTPPGEIEELVAHLERLSKMLPGDEDLRSNARKTAEKWTWSKFRRGLISSLHPE